MDHPARDLIAEIEWIGRNGFDFDRWGEYLDWLGHTLLHVHLSEYDGMADQHLPRGAAPRRTTDWPGHMTKIQATGDDGTITLEVFSPQREDLLLSRDLLRGWWDAPEQRGGQQGSMEKSSQP